jgi:hypothetical protein
MADGKVSAFSEILSIFSRMPFKTERVRCLIRIAFEHGEDGDDHGGEGDDSDAADEEAASPSVRGLGAVEHRVADGGGESADAGDHQARDHHALDPAMLNGDLPLEMG